MNVVHRLVGYDRKTQSIAFEKDIPRDRLGTVKKIANVPPTDPDAVHDYELTTMQARDLAGYLGAAIDADRLQFFLEAFDLDFQKTA